MATASEVKTGLDAIAAFISARRSNAKSYKAAATTDVADLDGLAAAFADLIATVDGYGTSNAFEALAKAELAKLTAEFGALKTQLQTVAGISV
jgi:hypothetical protein